MKRISSETAIRWAVAGSLALLIALPASFAQAPTEPDSGMQATQPAALLSPAQLDDLVAPIALYPDPLLGQLLVASTYPLEIVEAQQWLTQNRGLQGQALMDAARQQNWDPSVQAMVAFPNVLATMNQDVQWTTALGNAFLAQQSDVMAAVQRMRGRAQANGKLNSTPQQTVTSQTQDGQTAINVTPTDPQVIYVPQYNPVYVWGPPVWGYYPPLAYYGYGFGFYPGINIGLSFAGWGGWGWGGWGWGWGFNWFHGGVFVNSGFFAHYGFHSGYLAAGFAGRAAWQHDPGHRLGVSYPNHQLASRYGAASMASRSAMTRSNFSSARGAGTGNWNRFGSASGSTFANRSAGTQGERSAATANNGARSEMGRSPQFQGGQRFSQGDTGRSSTPAQHYSAPSNNGARGNSVSSASRSFGSNAAHNSGGGGSHSFGGGHSGGGHSGGGHR